MNLQETRKELQTKISLIQKEVQEKESKVSELHANNTKLIEANIGKERKPKSLEQQRKAIAKANDEIIELKLVEGSLRDKLTKTNSDIEQEQLKNQVAQFHEASEAQLSIVETVRRNLNALGKSLFELDLVAGENGALYNLFRTLSGNSEARQYIDLNRVLQTWSVTNVNLELPLDIDTRLTHFNNQIFGRHNQLQAIFNGD